ncbi:MAG TPA: hypothetical protein VML75_04240, partial [Kofleriaceae bacterium]|nr:hypothetical protein [Kofleriaceae bacterium]
MGVVPVRDATALIPDFSVSHKEPYMPPSPKIPKTGLEALLRPADSILVLIDHQPFQFANLNSHE